jgi:hypothetical protein
MSFAFPVRLDKNPGAIWWAGEKAPPKSASRLIESFLDLPDGWHFGEGRGATEAAVAVAKKVDALFLNIKARAIEAFPCVDGGITVCGRYKNEDLEVLCRPDGHLMDIWHEKDDHLIVEENDLSSKDVTDYVEALSWGSRSSAYFILGTLVETGNALRAQHFKILATAPEFQCLAMSAREGRMEASATIFDCVTTPTYQAQCQSYGVSTPQIYQQGEQPFQTRPIEIPAI